ncbi:MAG: fasciclin domain-containing protein [Sandaracinaceae bacterium]|nr:fasciclin domain-containing protein [Sandaracinaceae bacterium]
MRNGTKLEWTVGLLALAIAAGCDGDSGTDAGMTGGDAGMTETDGGPTGTDAGTDAATASNTIVDVAVGNPDFSLLVAAVTRAGLVETLSGAGPFTVFAPNDAAFAASGITRAMVDAMPIADLAQILTYHVIAARVPSSAVAAGPVDTVADLSLIVGTTGGVTLNGGNAVTGGANVIAVDVAASNGVIHVIDRVLLPPTVADLARYAGLTTLFDAVVAAELAEALSGAGPFTVFAPVNEAFPATAPPNLAQILLYHVVSGRVPSTAVPARAPALATVEYSSSGTTRAVPLTLLFDTTSGVRINGGSGTGAGNLGANVVVADVKGTNGVVHVIDRVLLPLSIAQVAIAGGFTSLVAAVTASDPIPASLAGAETPVLDALSAPTLAPLTVFAPTDAAFGAAFPGGLPSDGGAILGVLALHVLALPLPVRAADIPSTPVAPLAGSNLAFDTTATPPTVRVTGGGTTAGVVVTDIGATNGIVHVIDGVLLEGP